MTDVYKAAKKALHEWRNTMDAMTDLAVAVDCDRGEAVIEAVVRTIQFENEIQTRRPNWPDDELKYRKNFLDLREAVRAYLEAQAETGEGERVHYEQANPDRLNEMVKDSVRKATEMRDDMLSQFSEPAPSEPHGTRKSVLPFVEHPDPEPASSECKCEHRDIVVEPGITRCTKCGMSWVSYRPASSEPQRPKYWQLEPASSECGTGIIFGYVKSAMEAGEAVCIDLKTRCVSKATDNPIPFPDVSGSEPDKGDGGEQVQAILRQPVDWKAMYDVATFDRMTANNERSKAQQESDRLRKAVENVKCQHSDMAEMYRVVRKQLKQAERERDEAIHQRNQNAENWNHWRDLAKQIERERDEARAERDKYAAVQDKYERDMNKGWWEYKFERDRHEKTTQERDAWRERWRRLREFVDSRPPISDVLDEMDRLEKEGGE